MSTQGRLREPSAGQQAPAIWGLCTRDGTCLVAASHHCPVRAADPRVAHVTRLRSWAVHLPRGNADNTDRNEP
jgi:hypothetical protein